MSKTNEFNGEKGDLFCKILLRELSKTARTSWLRQLIESYMKAWHFSETPRFPGYVPSMTIVIRLSKDSPNEKEYYQERLNNLDSPSLLISAFLSTIRETKNFSCNAPRCYIEFERLSPAEKGKTHRKPKPLLTMCFERQGLHSEAGALDFRVRAQIENLLKN